MLGLGDFLGALTLLSPVFLPAALLMLLAEFLAQAAHRRRVFVRGTILLTLSTAVVAPWIFRNYVVLGGFVPTRSNLGLELYVGNHDGQRHARGPGSS